MTHEMRKGKLFSQLDEDWLLQIHYSCPEILKLLVAQLITLDSCYLVKTALPVHILNNHMSFLCF